MEVRQDVPPSETAAPNGTLAAERVADLLLVFLSNPGPLGVSDIARTLGLSKAVVHRILQSLSSRGLIATSSSGQRYRLGPVAMTLSTGALCEYDDTWHHAAAPILSELRGTTGETATLSARFGALRIFVDQLESLDVVRMTVALWRPRPLCVGASGKAMLAFLDGDLRGKIIHHQLVVSRSAGVDLARRLRDDLDTVSRTGVARSRGEVNPSAASLAAPILRNGTEVVGAVSICGPIGRLDDAKLARFTPLLRSAGRQLSELVDTH